VSGGLAFSIQPSSFQPPEPQSSHPDIESHAISMKTMAEIIFNRHTFTSLPINLARLLRGEAFGCLDPRRRQSEQKTKGEEKALAAVALAEEANRNRPELKFG
jgi:hypothetical protein